MARNDSSTARDKRVRDIDKVLQKAREGDESVLPEIRRLLDRGQVQPQNDMLDHAIRALTRSIIGKDVAGQEVMRRKILSVRDELAGPNPTPLERLLCERVALAWFDSMETDRRYMDQSDVSFKVADYRESRRERALKRFLSASATLAKVRRLMAPSVQINQVVGNQQLNLGDHPALPPERSSKRLTEV